MNAFLITTLLAALTGGPDGDQKRGEVVVRCKSEALIRGAEILLRDVAVIEARNQELSTRIGDIHVANRPALGFNRVFPRADLMRLLVSKGLSPDQIEMRGAAEVVAQPLATTLKPADILAVTDPIMQKLASQHGTEVEFELRTKLSTMRVPPGRFDLSLRPKLRDGQVRPSSAMIDVDLIVDEKVYKTIQVAYRLRHFALALTTNQVITRDQPLSEENLRLERVEVTPGTNMFVGSFDQVRGLVAKRDIANNKQLRSGDLAKPALIRKNDLVTLIARRGRVQVSTKGIALEDAPLGGRLRVRNLTNKNISYAVVEASGIAIIPN